MGVIQTWPWVKMDVPTAFNGWYPTQDKLGWMDTQRLSINFPFHWFRFSLRT
jgi:hypothetical protein